jgi:ankyrin repeat protein
MQLVAKPIFHCSPHHVAHDVTTVACRRGRPAHGFPVAAVQRERHAQRFAVVAAELEAVRTPTLVAARHGHLAIVPALLPRRSRATLHQQTMRAHDAIDALRIERHLSGGDAFITQRAPDAAIAIAGQIGDNPADFFDHHRIVGLLGFRPPVIERRVTNSHLAADLRDRRTQFGLLQRVCDLLFGEPALLHGMTSWS